MLAGLSLFAFAVIAADAPSAAGVRLDFHEKAWKEVLADIAKPLGLAVQIDFDPPGTFTYKEAQPVPPEKALEIVHGRCSTAASPSFARRTCSSPSGLRRTFTRR